MRFRSKSRLRLKVATFLTSLALALLTLATTATAGFISFFGEQVACVTRNLSTHLVLAGPICLFGTSIRWLFDQLARLVGILLEAFIRLIMSALTWNPQFYPLYTTGCDVEAGACASQGISHLLIYIMAVLMPLYVMLILYTGIQLIFFSLSPQGRARAKSRLNEFITSMIVVSLAPIFYQIILDVAQSIVYAVLDVAIDSLSSQGTDLAGFLIGFMVLARALLPFSFWLLLLALVAAIVILLRYVMVMLYGVLFPAILFLYLWEATKPIGAKFLRTSIMWIFVPVAQALFFTLVIISLVQAGSTIGAPLIDAEEALFDLRLADAWAHIQDLGPGFLEALKSMLLVAAGLVGIVLAPFMMSGLLQIMGGVVGFMGTASVPHREGGAALVGAGTLMIGAGAESLIAAGATAGYLKKGDAGEGIRGGSKAMGSWFRKMGSDLSSRGGWRDIAHYSAAGLFPEKFHVDQAQGTFQQGTARHTSDHEDGGTGGGGSTSSGQTGKSRTYSEQNYPAHKETQHRVKGVQSYRPADRETRFDQRGNVPHTHVGVHDNPLPLVPLELSTRFDRVQRGLHTMLGGMSLMAYIHQSGGAGQATKKFFTGKDHAGRGVFRRTLKGLSVIAPALMPVSPFMPIRMIGRELLGFVPIAFPKWLGGNLIFRRAANLMIGAGFRQHYHRRRADARLGTLRGEYDYYHNAERKAQDAGNTEKADDMSERKEKVASKFQQELDRLRTDPEGLRRTDPYYYDKKLQILIDEAKKHPNSSDAALLHAYLNNSETDMLGREASGRKVKVYGDPKTPGLINTYLDIFEKPRYTGTNWAAHKAALRKSPDILFNAVAYDHIKDSAPELLKHELPKGASKEAMQKAIFDKLQGPDADALIKQAIAVREIKFRDQHAKNFRVEDGAFKYETLERDDKGFIFRDDNGATRTIARTADPDAYSRLDRKNSAIYVKGHVKLEGGMKYAAQVFEIQRMTNPLTGKSWDKYNLDIRRMGPDGKDLYLSREQYAYLHDLVGAVGYGKGVDAWDYELFAPTIKAIENKLPPEVTAQYFMAALSEDPNSAMIFSDARGGLFSANPGLIDPRNQVRRIKPTETTDSYIEFLGVDQGRKMAHFGDGWHARVHEGAEILSYADSAPRWDKSVKAYALRDANGNVATDYFVVHEVYDQRSKGERETDPRLAQPDRIPEEHKYESWTVVDLRSDDRHKIRHNFLVNEKTYQKIGAAEAERLLEERRLILQRGAATEEERETLRKADTLLVYSQDDFEKHVYLAKPARDLYRKDGLGEAIRDKHFVVTDIEHGDLRMRRALTDADGNHIYYADDGSIPEADRRYLEAQGVEDIDYYGTPGLPVVQRGVWVAERTFKGFFQDRGGDYYKIVEDPATGEQHKVAHDMTPQERRALEQALDTGQVVQRQNGFYDVTLHEVQGVRLRDDGKIVEKDKPDSEAKEFETLTFAYNAYTDTYGTYNEATHSYDIVPLTDEEAAKRMAEKGDYAALAAVHELGHFDLRTMTATRESSRSADIAHALFTDVPSEAIRGNKRYQAIRSALENTDVTMGDVKKSAMDWAQQYGDPTLLGSENLGHLANELYANAAVQKDPAVPEETKRTYFQRDVLEKVAYFSGQERQLDRGTVANMAQLRTVAEANDLTVDADFAAELDRAGIKDYEGKHFTELFDDIVAARGHGESTTYNQARRASKALWDAYMSLSEEHYDSQ